MGYSVVQHATGHASTGTTASATFASNITPGNYIVVVGFCTASSVLTLSAADNSSGGNTYASVLTVNDATNGDTIEFWTAPIVNGGGTKPTVTVTASGALFGIGIDILEVSGITGAKDVSASVTNGASTSTPSSGATAASTAANELVIGGYMDPGIGLTVATAAGWTDAGTQGTSGSIDFSGEYEDSGASGSKPNATWTLGSASGGWMAAVVVFTNASTVAGPAFMPGRMPLGC